MLRSFSYAAYAALFAFTVHSSADYPTLEGWGDEWEHWVSNAFFTEYLGTMAPSGLLPDDESIDPLLQALVLDKALYELGYELNNRPDWVQDPADRVAEAALTARARMTGDATLAAACLASGLHGDSASLDSSRRQTWFRDAWVCIRRLIPYLR